MKRTRFILGMIGTGLCLFVTNFVLCLFNLYVLIKLNAPVWVMASVMMAIICVLSYANGKLLRYSYETLNDL